MKKGVNLIGYARAEFGLGEACRSAAKALKAAGIHFCIINFPHCPARQNDFSWKHKEINEPIYNTNIFFINADQLDYQYKKRNLPKRWFLNRYNIGYWHWELPVFPKNHMNGLRLVNEIWAPSKFTSDSIKKRTSKPVRVIPHAISLEMPSRLERAYFGLPQKAFLFLAMCDMRSFSSRKNPFGAIEAFKQAFSKDDNSVGLILKVNNGNHSIKDMNILRKLAGDNNNIFFIEKVLNRHEVNGLVDLADCFVSLHRSEGFGLPLAEAMFLGEPVIGTNWSGNVDFMKPDNSLLVNFSLKKIGINHGPYAASQLWAEPDLNHASELMKKLAGDPSYVKRVAINGQEMIRNNYSPSAIGNMYLARLKELKLL